jgi:hypothetical protein
MACGPLTPCGKGIGLRWRTLEIENEHDDENENDLGGDFEDVECRKPDRPTEASRPGLLPAGPGEEEVKRGRITYSRQAVPACFRRGRETKR